MLSQRSMTSSCWTSMIFSPHPSYRLYWPLQCQNPFVRCRQRPSLRWPRNHHSHSLWTLPAIRVCTLPAFSRQFVFLLGRIITVHRKRHKLPNSSNRTTQLSSRVATSGATAITNAPTTRFILGRWGSGRTTKLHNTRDSGPQLGLLLKSAWPSPPITAPCLPSTTDVYTSITDGKYSEATITVRSPNGASAKATILLSTSSFVWQTRSRSPGRVSPVRAPQLPSASRYMACPPWSAQTSSLKAKAKPFTPTQRTFHRPSGPSTNFQQFTNPLGIFTEHGIQVPERLVYVSNPQDYTLKPTANSHSLGLLENECVGKILDKNLLLKSACFPINPRFTELLCHTSKYVFAW